MSCWALLGRQHLNDKVLHALPLLIGAACVGMRVQRLF